MNMLSRLRWKWWWWRFTVRKKISAFFRYRLNSIFWWNEHSKRWLWIFLIIFILIVFAGGFFIFQSTGADPEAAQENLASPLGEEVSFYWHRAYELDTFNQILASPLIGEMDTVPGADILIANALGAVYALNGATGDVIYRFALEDRVVASPFFIDFGEDENANPIREPFLLDENGAFYALAVRTGTSSGDYLYRSRDETFAGKANLANKVFGKPAYGLLPFELGEQGVIFMGGTSGMTAAYESLYGRQIWTNDTLFRSTEEIFAAPLLLTDRHLSHAKQEQTPALPGMVIFAGTKGTIAALHAETGVLLWRFVMETPGAQLNEQSDGVRGGMSAADLVPSSPGMEVALLSYRGSGQIISTDGESLCGFDLTGTFVSSLSKGRFYAADDPLAFLAVSAEGQFFTVHVDPLSLPQSSSSSPSKLRCTAQLLAERPRANFIASPITADFNLDGISDILIASRQGELFLINGQNGQDLLSPFALGYAMTSTPAVGDLTGDGNLEVILAGENGTVTLLSLVTMPEGLFPPYGSVSPMFLRNIYNHN